MQISVPLKINYKTEKPVPIPEIISALNATHYLVTETTSLLPDILPELDIESVDIGLRELKEGSLKELVVVTLIVTFQEDINDGIPWLLNEHFELVLPEKMETLVSIIFLILVLQGTGLVKDYLVKRLQHDSGQKVLDGLLSDLSKHSGQSVKSLRKKLDDRYLTTSSAKRLVQKAINFIRPSKSQKNEEISVGDNSLPSNYLRSVPAEFEIAKVMEEVRHRTIANLELEIHQKDKDRDQAGWAAIPIGIYDKRLPTKLAEGICIEDLWTKDIVIADCLLIERRSGLEFIPKEIHVLKIHN